MTRKLFLGDLFCWLIKVISFGLIDLCGDKDPSDEIDPCANPSPGVGFEFITPFTNTVELRAAVTAYLENPMNTQEFGATMNDWDVSQLTSLREVFRDRRTFNEDISCWDVGQITNFIGAFINAETFNQDIGRWDVSAGTFFDYMFFGAMAFNQDIGRWDVSSGVSFFEMFAFARAFNQDLCEWGAKISDPNANFEDMFIDSACPVRSATDLSATPPGPFCNACVSA